MARRGDPAPGPRPPPRVLGVDDWTWRRGHRYGTVLVDLEQNRVLDLLPDRRAESLAAWLKRNPGVEIVARDRAGVYADGVRQGAPDAVQVADRWHLLRNLGDALRAIVERHHVTARRIAAEVAGGTRTAGTPVTEGPDAATTPRGPAAHAGRRARFEEAVRLHAAGVSLRQIARLLGTDCKTVRRWLRAGDIPSWRQPRRGSMLDAHRDHLERRGGAGGGTLPAGPPAGGGQRGGGPPASRGGGGGGGRPHGAPPVARVGGCGLLRRLHHRQGLGRPTAQG